jgi:thymidylate kinase
MEIGKFIVIYGVNNLGKSTQIKKLIERLRSMRIIVEYLKYAIYDLEPSGPIINGYLREGNPYDLIPREFQIIQALNRTQYEPTLKAKLNSGTWIIAEDYAGSAMMWGMAAGVDRDFLIRTNNHLLQPDLAFLLHGQRFLKSIEAKHIHEQDSGLTDKAAPACEDLAILLDWKKILANQTEDQVAADIWKEIAVLLG